MTIFGVMEMAFERTADNLGFMASKS